MPDTTYELEIPDTLADKLAALGYENPLDGLYAATKLLVGLGPDVWGTITRTAEIQKIAPAKVVLGLISKADAVIAKKPTRNTGRDQAIWDMAKKGATHAVIAARFNLSLIRVSQIVATQRAKAKAAEEADNNAMIDGVVI